MPISNTISAIFGSIICVPVFPDPDKDRGVPQEFHGEARASLYVANESGRSIGLRCRQFSQQAAFVNDN
jgi:hypothetical protein